jgi:hypothetical protein
MVYISRYDGSVEQELGSFGDGYAVVVDQGKLDAFIGKAISEWGAAAGVLLVFIGDKLGLFKAILERVRCLRKI